LIAAFLKMRSD